MSRAWLAALCVVGCPIVLDATEVKYFWKIPYIKFSLKGRYLRNTDGTLWLNPVTGKPKYEWKVDPDPVPGITEMGFDFSYDATQYEILTEPGTHGFLCEFSAENICVTEPIEPVTYGSPLPGSTWNFDVSEPGRILFSYDFSSTPTDIPVPRDFFAFQMAPIADALIHDGVIEQNFLSPAQYCKTTISDGREFSNDCGSPVPEPAASYALLGGLGLLGILAKTRRARSHQPYN